MEWDKIIISILAALVIGGAIYFSCSGYNKKVGENVEQVDDPLYDERQDDYRYRYQ